MANYQLRIGQTLSYPLSAEVGSYSLSGQNATLSYLSSGSAYAPYPSLDLNTIPFHTGAGAWGAQQAIIAPTPPTITREVTVTNAAALSTELRTPGTRVIVDFSTTADISVVGSVVDAELVVPDTVSLGNILIGRYLDTAQVTRLRVRGSTLGTLSGGNIAVLTLLSNNTNNIHIDGIRFRSGNNKNCGMNYTFYYGAGANEDIANYTAITNCQFHSEENCGYILSNHLVIAGNCTSSGVNTDTTAGEDEAWCFRTRGAPCVIYDNYLKGRKYHRFRIAPRINTSATQHCYVANNTMVDLNQGRISWFGFHSADNVATDAITGAWFINNVVYAENQDGDTAISLEFPNVSTYARVTGNTFYGDFSQGTLASEENIIDATDTDFTTGNAFNSIAAYPDYDRVGSPESLQLNTWTSNVPYQPFGIKPSGSALSFSVSYTNTTGETGYMVFVSKRSRSSSDPKLYPYRYVAAADTTSLSITDSNAGTKYVRTAPFTNTTLGTVSSQTAYSPV